MNKEIERYADAGRGGRQKVVSDAYRDNWNDIFLPQPKWVKVWWDKCQWWFGKNNF